MNRNIADKPWRASSYKLLFVHLPWYSWGYRSFFLLPHRLCPYFKYRKRRANRDRAATITLGSAL